MDCVLAVEADVDGLELSTMERVSPSLKDNSPRPYSPASTPHMNCEEGGGGGDNSSLTPPPLKMRSPRGGGGSAPDGSSTTDPPKSSAPVSSVMISPKHKDPDRIKKDREREERVRQARERLEEERRKKLIELQEQMRQAQENRDRQLEMRRKKIEDLRKREMERRAEVERRRQEKENAEKSRRETLLLKAEERVARYEAWKRGGQKGPPPGCAMPTAKHLSVSTSVLYHKRSSDFASSGALNTTNRPDSLMALNTIPEGRRSVVAPSTLSTSRHKSTLALSSPSSSGGSTSASGGVKVRENRSPRKPRPASVAGSVATFVSVGEGAKASSLTPRSQSSDRLARERPRSRGAVSASRAEDKEEEEKKTSDKPGVRMSRRTLDRLSTPRQTPQADGDRKDSNNASTPRRDGNLVRTSPRKAYSTSNLAMPRQKPSLREKSTKEPSTKPQQQQTPRDTAIKRNRAKEAPAKITPQGTKTPPPSSSPLTVTTSTPRASSPSSPSRTPARVLSPPLGADEDGGSGESLARSPTPSEKEKSAVMDATTPSHSTPEEKSATAETTLWQSIPRETSTSAEETLSLSTPVEKSTEEIPQPQSMEKSPSRSTPTPAAEKSAGEATQPQSAPTPEKSTGDITAEEYKAKLAEKRRQAREKAEREAEEERRRQEEQERLEEEQRLKEEEEQRLRDEEALRLAEEARKAEEERLQKAIEAEEARRAEEAARLEQERLAKEEAERKAREEAERLEQEKQEKARREEEERLERKKRLEMIMKRVKTDSPGDSAKDSPRSVSSSPARNATPATPGDVASLDAESRTTSTTPSAQPEENGDGKRILDMGVEGSRSPASGTLSPANAPSPVPFQETGTSSSSQENMLEVKEGSTPTSSRSQSPLFSSLTATPRAPDSTTPRFKSPLLQKLVEGKDDAGQGSSPGEAPRFKSPLLQNLLSKTRVGARMGLTQDHSQSSPDLSQGEGSGAESRASSSSPSSAMVMSTSMMDMDSGSKEGPTPVAMSSSMIDMSTVSSASKEELNSREEKDVDTSEHSSSSSPTHLPTTTTTTPSVANGGSEGSAALGAGDENSTAGESCDVLPDGVWSGQDSQGVGLKSAQLYSITPALSLNGHSEDLDDASFDMQTTDIGAGNDSPFTPTTTTSPSPHHEHSRDDRNFEELIDLSLSQNNNPSNPALLVHSDQLISFNKLEDESQETSPLPPPPIIAFEESSMRKQQDVTDLLS